MLSVFSLECPSVFSGGRDQQFKAYRKKGNRQYRLQFKVYVYPRLRGMAA